MKCYLTEITCETNHNNKRTQNNWETKNKELKRESITTLRRGDYKYYYVIHLLLLCFIVPLFSCEKRRIEVGGVVELTLWAEDGGVFEDNVEDWVTSVSVALAICSAMWCLKKKQTQVFCHTQLYQKKVKSAYERSSHQTRAYPGFCSMKQLGIFQLPVDGKLVYHRATPALNSLVPIGIPGWREALWM